MMKPMQVISLGLLVACWLGAIAYGSAWLNSYSTTPGELSKTLADQWPAEYEHPTGKDGYCLALFVHPKCPCSRATLSELARLQHDQPALDLAFYFYAPSNQSTQWVETDLWRTAQRLTSNPIHLDTDGQLAKVIGATTSGHAVLVDPDHKIVYSGGLTSARGHEGDNKGCEAILDLTSGQLQTDETFTFPVFGCPIHTPESTKKTSACCEKNNSENTFTNVSSK